MPQTREDTRQRELTERFDTLLPRQAHPNFVKDDIVTSLAFVPFSKDQCLLSACDGDQITPAESYRNFIEVRENRSHSVWAEFSQCPRI